MFNFAAQNAGMAQPSKKPTHRGRKPSAKPGADHLSKLQQAHGSGDHQSAKLHALNYANAVTKHLKAPVMGDEPEMSGQAPDPVDAPSAAPMSPPAPNPRAALAKLAMSRRK